MGPDEGASVAATCGDCPEQRLAAQYRTTTSRGFLAEPYGGIRNTLRTGGYCCAG